MSISSETTNPSPESTKNSISTSLSVVTVAITWSGFIIFTPGSVLISAAVITLGPLTESVIFFSPGSSASTTISFTFKIISVTASFTPSIVENSFKTPSILIPFMAEPGIDDNNILLKAFPIVLP